MDGTLTIEDGDLLDFLGIAISNMYALDHHWSQRVSGALSIVCKELIHYNPIHRAKKNVAHHYDLSGRLYDLFL